MGGRRGGNLLHLVGTGAKVTEERRNLSRAISAEDADAIATASTRLVANSGLALDALRYGLKLAPYISAHADELARLEGRDRAEAIRHAWAEVKALEGLKTNPEIDSAVVTAASEAVKHRG